MSPRGNVFRRVETSTVVITHTKVKLQTSLVVSTSTSVKFETRTIEVPDSTHKNEPVSIQPAPTVPGHRQQRTVHTAASSSSSEKSSSSTRPSKSLTGSPPSRSKHTTVSSVASTVLPLVAGRLSVGSHHKSNANPTAIPSSYASFRNSDASSIHLSKDAIISIAVAVPLVIILMLAAAIVIYRRKRHGTSFGGLDSANDDYHSPTEAVDLSYRTNSMMSTGYGSYDYYAPRALLGADTSKLWPLTLPSSDSQSPPMIFSGGLPSPTPPTSPPKNEATSSWLQDQRPRMPLRAAWHRAHVALKRTRAQRQQRNSGFSCVFPDITYLHDPSPIEPYPQPVATKSIFSGINSNSAETTEEATAESREAAIMALEKEEEDSMTHPAFRRGSFSSRVAPRTPKTPAFSFGFDDSSQQVDTYAHSSTSYELAEPDFGRDGIDCDWENVDLGSPYQPPADMYHQLANPIPEINEQTDYDLGERTATMPTAAQVANTTTATWTSVNSQTAAQGTASNSLFPPLLLEQRPVSSIYSEYVPSHEPSPPPNPPILRPSRFAERGLSIRTTQLPRTPTPAREYTDMLAWPLPLNVTSSATPE